MKKKLRVTVFSDFVVLVFSVFQIYSSQAMDTMAISLIQPDGTKRTMKLNLDQPLSELRSDLISKGIDILPDDKFQTNSGDDIHPCDEALWKVREVIDHILSFKPRGSFKRAEEEKHPVEMSLIIPSLARGYEEIYLRFLKGVLVYKPKKGSDEGRIDIPIAALSNPLEDTFDLSRCTDKAYGVHVSQYLSISTGYRKKKKEENAEKVEIWISPRFLIGKELKTTAKHFEGIFSKWSESAAVGIFWNYGKEDDLTRYDYLTEGTMDTFGQHNLLEKWRASGLKIKKPNVFNWEEGGHPMSAKNFHLYFPN